MPIFYKTRQEIELIRESSQLVSQTLGMLAEEIKPGITPLYLDRLAESFIRDHHAKPGFLGLYGFPNTLCISINEAVVHGIPNDKPLEEGDLVSIDCGALKNTFYGDQAYTFEIGEVREELRQLCKITKECLQKGIEQVQEEKRIGAIGRAVYQHAHKHGYGVVRELVGHGLGKEMHEEPNVPNFGHPSKGSKLHDGIVLAIEPMITLGRRFIRRQDDGWTIVTADKKPAAHFEHTVALMDGKADVLSTFEYIEEALQQKL